MTGLEQHIYCERDRRLKGTYDSTELPTVAFDI